MLEWLFGKKEKLETSWGNYEMEPHPSYTDAHTFTDEDVERPVPGPLPFSLDNCDDAYKTFGNRLRQALEDHGYSQARFAETIAMSLDSLNTYVNGRRYPGYQVILRFIEFLPGVDVTWLITGQTEEERF